MTMIRATVRQGRLETDEPVDLPDGTELLIPIADNSMDDEAGWDNTPEGIAAWMRWYQSLEPLIFTPEEQADTETWLKRMDAYSAANMDAGVEDVFR